MSEIKISVKRLPPCCLRCKYYMKGRMYGDGDCIAAGAPKPLFDVTVSRHRAPFCPLVLRSADHAQEQDDLGGEAHE